MPSPTHSPLGLVNRLSLVALCLITVIPFLQPYHTYPQGNFYSEWSAFALGILAGIVLLARSFWEKLAVPKVAVYVLGLLAVILLQGALLSHTYMAQWLIPALYLGWTVLLMAVTYWLRSHFGTEKLIATLAWFLLGGGILQALAGLAQLIGSSGLLGTLIMLLPASTALGIFGNLAQQNQFASHITLAAVALAYLFALRQLSWKPALFITVLLTCALVLSGSRTALLYGPAIVLLSFLGYRKTRDAVHLRLLAGSLALVAVFCVAHYALPPLVMLIKQGLALPGADTALSGTFTLQDKMHMGTSSIGMRASEWHKAWLMFLQAPVLGVGVGHYGWHSYAYQALPEFSGIAKPYLFNHSHNLFMQVMAEMGAVGLVILALMLLGWLRQFMQHWLSPGSWFIAACLLVLFIHSNLEFPLWFSYFLGIAAILLALGDARSITVRFSPRLGPLAAGLSIALLSGMLIFTFKGYRQLESLSLRTSVGMPPAVMSMLISDSAILRPYAEMTIIDLFPLDKNDVRLKLAINTRLAHWYPVAHIVYRRTLLLALDGQLPAAQALLQRAARVYPLYLPAYIDILKKSPEQAVKPLLEEAEKIASQAAMQ